MSMMISIVSITAFVMMTIYMFTTAHFGATRRVATLSLTMTVAEIMLFGWATTLVNPTVIMLAVAARAVVFTVCVMAMKTDREAYKARERARNRFRADMINTMEPLRLVRRQRAAAQIDIVA